MPHQASSSGDVTTLDAERRIIFRFYEQFFAVATLQGRLAYFLMSFHAVNPDIFKRLLDHDPHNVLFANMVYGIGAMIYSRPSMAPISKFNRLSFSILGSLMFNHGSMLFYNWLLKNITDRPYVLTFMGFLSGRIMMLHLLAYLYHADSRFRGFRLRNFSEYDSMYRTE